MISAFIEELREDVTNMMKVELVKDKICSREIPYGRTFEAFSDLQIERDIGLLRCCCPEESGVVVFPTSLFLCALDKLQVVFFTKLYWRMADLNNKYPGHSIYARGTTIFNYLTSLRAKMGQKFFKLMNIWEPLVIGWTVTQGDDVGKPNLYQGQLDEFVDVSSCSTLIERS
ncbi:hypothetical protein M8J77_007495 [Diaphorina citri]|nr:hypothetical protein M8J77_007495 [Diaphorina citri]